MHSTLSIASALALVAGQTLAATFEVMTDGIAFSPSSVEDVAEGDQIRVTFSTSIPHNIISSTYQSPCTYNEAGGIASLTYNQGEVFVFTVNSTDPQWFYCDVGDHCNDGMIFAINPSADESVSDAQSRAADAQISRPGNAVALGGAVEGEGGSAPSSSSVSGSGSSSMSMPMSTGSTATTAAPTMSTGAMGGGSASEQPSGSQSTEAAPASTSNGAVPTGAPFAMAGALLAGAAAFAL